ncbi:hypothetical protein [Sphingobium bisphenolivorans]|uniref:hypothetical protein n=1 Tax=Sphingobium bisphenolivorans TaxID=1335760 RepID=UPI000566E940|nr:hypothetical protein [Sphingobium bisphenolivorans]
MASDRMTQAIATLERAVTGLEQELGRLMTTPAPESSSSMDEGAARQALQSLDLLINELKGRTSG